MDRQKVTTEELDAMIQHGFAETARKDDVDRRFDGVDKRLDAIEDKLEKLMLEDHKRRIERLERTRSRICETCWPSSRGASPWVSNGKAPIGVLFVALHQNLYGPLLWKFSVSMRHFFSLVLG